MTNSDTPWEPPLAGTEVEHLVGALDRLVHLSWPTVAMSACAGSSAT